MKLTSQAFRYGEKIPRKYTGIGQDMSPPLEWHDEPTGTKSYVLMSDDPDAPGGPWTHWVMYNIPKSCHRLPENVEHVEFLPDGSRNGVNSWDHIGYDGPYPPSGLHRYYFKLYALDTDLDLPEHSNRRRLLKAMRRHILAEADLMGTCRAS